MLLPTYLNSFEKEIARDKKRGKDLSKLRKVMNMLLKEEPLPHKNRNHKLKGEFEGYWECHIEPDWLLVYKKTNTHIIFVRTGSHSDLF
jgi:mRNA interferase YafQ